MNSGLYLDYGNECFDSPFVVPIEAGSHLTKPTGNRAERISELEPLIDSGLFRLVS